MTDFTKSKKRKLEFEPRLLNLNITKILMIFNETGLNEIVHIEGVVLDLKEELTIFGDLMDEVNENSSYKISYLRVAKYDYER